MVNGKSNARRQPQKNRQQWRVKSNSSYAMGGARAVINERISTADNRMSTQWGLWATVAYEIQAGMGHIAHFPVRLLTEASGQATAPWVVNAANRTAMNLRYTADIVNYAHMNKNLVPIAYEIQVESMTKAGSTVGSACREGGIMVGFYNRNSILGATGQTINGVAIPTQYINWPKFDTVLWSDIGFSTPLLKVGTVRTIYVKVPDWATGWTLEDAHQKGKSFVIRCTAPNDISCNISIRALYQRAATL